MCKCVTIANQTLKPYNTRISEVVEFPKEGGEMKTRIQISTEKILKKLRKPAMLAFATFCPFCGEKLEV